MHITIRKTKVIPARTVVKTKIEQVPKWLEDAVQEFVDLDRKINAIKLVRAYFNRNDKIDPICGTLEKVASASAYTLGLKETKDFVEQNFTKRVRGWEL